MSNEVKVPHEVKTRRFQPMLRARRFDETLWQHGDLVNDVFHVSIGYEAGAAAIACARVPGDAIVLSHRNHGVLAAIGADLELLYCELFGRDGGPMRGRGGSLHLMDPPHGVPYTSGMVGGGVPVAVGMALAHRLLKDGFIAFAHFGDGAMEEGIVYESLNIAHFWDAPVVFVCDNNSSGPQKSNNTGKFEKLAQVCEVAARTVSASSPSAVVRAVEEMADAARHGGGPQFLQVLCPSWSRGFWSSHETHHSQAVDTSGKFDIGKAPSATDDWSLSDPLAREVVELVAEGVTIEEMLAVDEKIKAEVERSVTAAIAAELAPISVVDDDVWAEQ